MLTPSPGFSVQYIDTYNSLLEWVFCWSCTGSTSSLLLYQLSPQSLCLMPQQCKSEIPVGSKVNTETYWGHSAAQEPLRCCFYRKFELVIQQSMFAFLLKKIPTFPFDTSQSTHRTKTMLKSKQLKHLP